MTSYEQGERKNVFFVLGSINLALKSKEILSEYGISSSISKPSRHIDGYSGCSYGIYLFERDAKRAEAILSKNEILPIIILRE